MAGLSQPLVVQLFMSRDYICNCYVKLIKKLHENWAPKHSITVRLLNPIILPSYLRFLPHRTSCPPYPYNSGIQTSSRICNIYSPAYSHSLPLPPCENCTQLLSRRDHGCWTSLLCREVMTRIRSLLRRVSLYCTRSHTGLSDLMCWADMRFA